MACPSPVAMAGLVVCAKICPAPPRARITTQGQGDGQLSSSSTESAPTQRPSSMMRSMTNSSSCSSARPRPRWPPRACSRPRCRWRHRRHGPRAGGMSALWAKINWPSRWSNLSAQTLQFANAVRTLVAPGCAQPRHRTDPPPPQCVLHMQSGVHRGPHGRRDAPLGQEGGGARSRVPLVSKPTFHRCAAPAPRSVRRCRRPPRGRRSCCNAARLHVWR